eukprot:scaffold348331_cov45-Prasinocladus_malaysianus.AAC.1
MTKAIKSVFEDLFWHSKFRACSVSKKQNFDIAPPGSWLIVYNVAKTFNILCVFLLFADIGTNTPDAKHFYFCFELKRAENCQRINGKFASF